MEIVFNNTLKSFNPSEAGWQFMWVILLVGLAGVGIAVERFIYIFLRSSKGRDAFLKDFGTLVAAKKFEEATSMCKASKLPIAAVLGPVIEARDKGKDALVAAADAAFLTEAPRVNRYLSVITLIASVATLLGLAGTIFGLIITFDAVANKPAAERPQALANGISIAMGTTLLGLAAAIPLLMVQGFLTMLSERVIQEMEEKSLKVINSFA
ncbi:MAG: MotA/TolQ/ExbB proton channel family protein [Fibromonadaceae bacterium]|jgi:biopolymer transport protein ExbB/TolQ|nr:MotA/TolQ/ExbB proton channel family protein [Fibromonadaceae bacterium]